MLVDGPLMAAKGVLGEECLDTAGEDGVAVAVEVRAINNRYFKLAIRATEGYAPLEPQIETVVRQSIRRGTLQVNLRVDRVHSPEEFQINAGVLDRYRVQFQSLYRQWDLPGRISLEALLTLPGVVDDRAARAFDPAADWPLIGSTLEAAMAKTIGATTTTVQGSHLIMMSKASEVAAVIEDAAAH